MRHYERPLWSLVLLAARTILLLDAGCAQSDGKMLLFSGDLASARTAAPVRCPAGLAAGSMTGASRIGRTEVTVTLAGRTDASAAASRCLGPGDGLAHGA
jgi:hypothetical protein